MILGFKNQFVPAILDGTKIHTIRKDPHHRWKPGMTIQMATGVRTKKYKCFKKAICVSVQEVRIEHVAVGKLNKIEHLITIKNDLINYVKASPTSKLKNIFLVHGESEESLPLRDALKSRGYISVEFPAPGDVYEV